MSRHHLVGSLSAISLFTLLAWPLHANTTASVLHAFSKRNGAEPSGGLIFDSAGNIYGTTQQGGRFNYGTVFVIRPPALGKQHWSEIVLHSFNYGPGDGAFPEAGLVMDKAGNLYGTTSAGGPNSLGTVFEIAPPKAGKTNWTEALLHGFGATSDDGFDPAGSLTMDGAGNLYGATFEGGKYNRGTIYRIAPPQSDGADWTETIVHTFRGPDGDGPVGDLVADAAGHLFGTTEDGGASDQGTVFELAPPAKSGDEWEQKVLLSFGHARSGGSNPIAGVMIGVSGSLFGTTYSGGQDGAGTVFELSPPAQDGGDWVETVLYSFVDGSSGGAFPLTGVIMDARGNIYGTTQSGGRLQNGTVFELSPSPDSSSGWRQKVLRSFDGQPSNEPAPYGRLTPDAVGNLYGTTYFGGAFGYGTVYKLNPFPQ